MDLSTSSPQALPSGALSFQDAVPSVEERRTVTDLLLRHGRGEDEALATALALVYCDLQRIAKRCLAGEKPSATFDSDSLAHEALLRLLQQDRTHWQNRAHLFCVAARIMRRILVDRARARAYAKRGAGWRWTTLDETAQDAVSGRLEVLALNDALDDLERHDSTLALLVELRFFAGLSNPEIGLALGVTSMTVIRRWRLARAWLRRYFRVNPEVVP